MTVIPVRQQKGVCWQRLSRPSLVPVHPYLRSTGTSWSRSHIPVLRDTRTSCYRCRETGEGETAMRSRDRPGPCRERPVHSSGSYGCIAPGDSAPRWNDVPLTGGRIPGCAPRADPSFQNGGVRTVETPATAPCVAQGACLALPGPSMKSYPHPVYR